MQLSHNTHPLTFKLGYLWSRSSGRGILCSGGRATCLHGAGARVTDLTYTTRKRAPRQGLKFRSVVTRRGRNRGGSSCCCCCLLHVGRSPARRGLRKRARAPKNLQRASRRFDDDDFGHVLIFASRLSRPQ